MGSSGFSYIEVLCVLGITSVITAITVTGLIKAKDKEIKQVEEYVEANYEVVEGSINNGSDR